MLQSVYPRINNQPIREAAGGGMVYCTNWIRLRDAKKHTIKAFLVIQRWSNIPMNFIFVTRVTRLIHNAGKYLLISIYPLPTHPTHNFAHKNGGNLDTLPGWPKKMHLNRPARCAGQWLSQACHWPSLVSLKQHLLSHENIYEITWLKRITCVLLSRTKRAYDSQSYKLMHCFLFFFHHVSCGKYG